jgi:HK97 family phage prohead protease
MEKDYTKNIGDRVERRFYACELRAPDKESRTVEGYAAVFESDSEVMWGSWVERIAPGAFSEVLKDDAVALFNHDPNLILARNMVNMTVTEDEKGLKYRFDAPNTTAGNDLLENLRNGNIKQSSFAFTVKDEEWQESKERSKPSLRTIKKVERLYDVSPVTYPAYPDTTVAQRSFQGWKQTTEKVEEKEKSKEEAREILKDIRKYSRKHRKNQVSIFNNF